MKFLYDTPGSMFDRKISADFKLEHTTGNHGLLIVRSPWGKADMDGKTQLRVVKHSSFFLVMPP